MPFSRFISIVFGILGSYYFIIILFDMLKSNNNVAQVISHAVEFDRSEKPVIISDGWEENAQPINIETEENLKRYLPPEESIKTDEVKKKSPMIDLGLETVSGDPYTVNAENLSKFMIA
jgi:glycosylphosphatidylinositol transamidase (GPIT) subunit GPI8